MDISVEKTKVLHVQAQGATSKVTPAEAKLECKYTCSHLGCRRQFANKHGLVVHKGKCMWSRWLEAEKIIGMQCEQDAGMPIGHGTAKFLVRWKDRGPNEDSWVPYEDVTPDLIKEYLVEHDLYDHMWAHRCPVCDKPAASEFGVRVHMRRKKNNCSKFLQEEDQNFTGTVAERKAKLQQKVRQQKQRPTVKCEGEKLDNVFLFKYLGSIFAADGTKKGRQFMNPLFCDESPARQDRSAHRPAHAHTGLVRRPGGNPATH